jgi:hypothetical protein
MWVGNKVNILTSKAVKKGKFRLKKSDSGTIIKHIGQVGLADETSEFLVETNSGRMIEITEDFLLMTKE